MTAADASDQTTGPQLTRRRLLQLGAAVAVVGGGALALSGGFGRDPRSTPSLVVGHGAPTLRGLTLSGDTLDLASLRGRVVLVNVWASWCAPCRAEYPVLKAAAEGLRSRGLQVIGVNTQDSAEKARAFLAELGGEPYPSIQDIDGRIAVAWGASGVPETFLLDGAGLVRERRVGEVTAAWVEQSVLPLLGG